MTKIKSLCENLPQSADGAVIISEENRRYLTGFPSSDGFLLITKDDALFITDSRYIEAAQRVVTDCETALQTDIYKQISEFFAHHGAKKIAVESDRITVERFNLFASKCENLEFLSDISLSVTIDVMRALKSREEVECIKTAQAIAEEAFEKLLSEPLEGLTEKEAQLKLDYFMLSHGAEALSFETIAVSGVNSSMPHGVPSSKVIEKGDFVTFDFGAVYKGYHSDMTRTVAVGSASGKMREVYGVVLSAQKAALSALTDGISGFDADKAARDVIEAAGYGKAFGHSTGHGVGIEIHEFPNASPKTSCILKAGHIITVEPGIYLPGEFGVRIEDMALITQSGCENLTNTPKELLIVK